MKSSKKIRFLIIPSLFLLASRISFAVTCPDPDKVSGSLGRFSQSEKETASFMDKSPGQEDDLDAAQRQGHEGIKFQVRPDCYSSDNFNMRGCPQNAFTTVTFSHVILNKFRSGDKGTVWCYYQTPDGSMISVNIDSARGGTYKGASPSGAGWGSMGRLLYRCQSTNVEGCPFDFEEGRLPNALSVE